jgi:hypothetical protein
MAAAANALEPSRLPSGAIGGASLSVCVRLCMHAVRDLLLITVFLSTIGCKGTKPSDSIQSMQRAAEKEVVSAPLEEAHRQLERQLPQEKLAETDAIKSEDEMDRSMFQTPNSKSGLLNSTNRNDPSLPQGLRQKNKPIHSELNEVVFEDASTPTDPESSQEVGPDRLHTD